MKLSLLLALMPLCVYASMPPMPEGVHRAVVMTDGVKVYPEGYIASKPQVDAVVSEATALDALVVSQATTLATLETELDTAQGLIDDASMDGVWWLQTYVNSIGILGGLPAYDGNLQIVDVVFTDTQVVITLWCSVVPVSATQLVVMGSTTLNGAFADKDFVCSFPTTVALPSNKTTGVCYTYTGTLPVGTSHFWKVLAQEGSLSGEDTGLPIYGGITVNGSVGLTTTITADDGTVLTFKSGILVEDVARQVGTP